MTRGVCEPVTQQVPVCQRILHHARTGACHYRTQSVTVTIGFTCTFHRSNAHVHRARHGRRKRHSRRDKLHSVSRLLESLIS
jgi:hypothetical protein